MDNELALVMIKLHYADLTWGRFADRFDLKLNPKDRDFLVGDCEFVELSSGKCLHVGSSKNIFIGCHKQTDLWFSYVYDRDENIISIDKMKQILTFEDKI